MRGSPARRDQQRWTPSLVVVSVLLLVALVVAGLLFVRVNRGDETDDFTRSTQVPGADATAGDRDSTAGDTAAEGAGGGDAGPVRITTIQAWDPFGDNGTENDAQAGNAIADGSSSTSWPTECYSDAYLNGKGGVGLVLGLSSAATGTLSLDALSAPYQIDVYRTDAADAPDSLDEWIQVGSTRFADEPGSIEATVEEPATHLLVWLRELGRDEVCSSANPYRGRIGEIAFQP
jgi:hypothetical protein